jgi:Protein of unknown function (DUF2971)
MRVYKFLDSHFALQSLSEKRLKISKFEDLNDPFELIPYNLSNQGQRWALQAMRRQLGQNRGMLCFSATWKDPVLWAHYADKHKGICIGFELPTKFCKRVFYVSKRSTFPRKVTLNDTAIAQVILYTKFKNWKYEQEVRSYITLEDEENGLYFADFGSDLRPFLVIAGARCTTTKAEIIKALGPMAKTVKLIKGRAGFRRFEIVKDKRGFKPESP